MTERTIHDGGIQGLGGLGFMVCFRVQCLGFGVWGMLQGIKFRVQGMLLGRFLIQGFGESLGRSNQDKNRDVSAGITLNP